MFLRIISGIVVKDFYAPRHMEAGREQLQTLDSQD